MSGRAYYRNKKIVIAILQNKSWDESIASR